VKYTQYFTDSSDKRCLQKENEPFDDLLRNAVKVFHDLESQTNLTSPKKIKPLIDKVNTTLEAMKQGCEKLEKSKAAIAVVDGP
jgi:hypothetical protein